MASAETVRIAPEALADVTRRILTSTGMSEADAEAAAEILVLADLMGIETHGTSRLDSYVERLQDGAFRPQARVEVIERSPALALVDGGGGLGPVVGQAGLRTALDLVRATGIAYVGCRDSNHFGALAPYAFKAASRGFVCLLGTAATTTMVPWGGREARIGNNPIGLGAPRPDGFPFILDMAVSEGARAKIRRARDLGQPIPTGWALDAQGDPTTDPERALEGFLAPIGGHKGAGLSLAVDLLCGLLSGGRFLSEIRSWVDETSEPQGLGHFFVLIDPDRLIGRDHYDRRMADFCRIVKETPPRDPERPVLLPGEPEGASHAERSRHGVPLSVARWQALSVWASAG